MYATYHNENVILQLLIFITVLSWLIFPLMLKQFAPVAFNIGFSIIAFVGVVGIVIYFKKNIPELQLLHRIMLLCWVSYLVALLFATIQASSMYSLTQWGFLFTKFLFCIFLCLYINTKYIITTFRIYSNLMMLTVIFAVLAMIFAVAGIQPISIVDVGGKSTAVYFGAYYVHSASIFAPAPIFRIQGLCDEPGTYAFALLPAFFWFLFAERSYLRSAVIVFGLILSMSLGTGLFLLLLMPMIWKYFKDYTVLVFFLAVILGTGGMYKISNYSLSRNIALMDDASLSVISYVGITKENLFDRDLSVKTLKKSLSSSPAAKLSSLQERVEGLNVVQNYLRNNMLGSGAAMGMSQVNDSISVGYAVAVLEAGIIGGIFYLLFFAIVGWLALKTITNRHNNAYEDRIRTVVALSVFSVLVMGAQRIQPDLSLWHMWLYACLFYLLTKSNDSSQKKYKTSLDSVKV